MLWLDGARYADSNGFQFDTARTCGWRDWVIQAYSQNMPYDQFVREQWQGLLPNPTRSVTLAPTGAWIHLQGGTMDEEYRVIYANDKTTPLAPYSRQPLECTLHDHKYDPLSMEIIIPCLLSLTPVQRKETQAKIAGNKNGSSILKFIRAGKTPSCKRKQLKPTKAVAEKQTLEIQKNHSLKRQSSHLILMWLTFSFRLNSKPKA